MDINTQTIFDIIERGNTSELAAILSRDPGLVHVRHADPELHHWTTLQFAAAKGNLPACRMLVERGAEVYTNPMNDCSEVTELLLAAGADITATDAKGRTALQLAENAHNAKITAVLHTYFPSD